MAVILRVDGTRENVVLPTSTRPGLTALQEAVGGYIERIFLGERGGDHPYMIVNEEGRIHNLPANAAASRLRGQDICGDVVLCTAAEVEAR